MPRPALLNAAVVVVLVSLAALTHRVWGDAAQEDSGTPRLASVDMLSLLEDFLRTDEFRPGRDALRQEWEGRLNEAQTAIQQIEAELRLASPADPGARALQQRYQQSAYEFQNMQRQASMEFDRFSADQAANAYARLHEAASALAAELGYTHLIASRREAEIGDRGNLATVTQEILARPLVVSPVGNDLTQAVRDRLAIPVETDEPAEGEAGPAEAAPADGAPAGETPAGDGEG